MTAVLTKVNNYKRLAGAGFGVPINRPILPESISNGLESAQFEMTP